MDFTDKVALVTGAASGIGREVARQLAEAGSAVVYADLNIAGAEQALGEDRPRMASAAIAVDVAEAESLDELIGRIVGGFERLDILVHCAGIGMESSFLETTIDQWRAIIDVDLTGTFLTCRAAARAMVPNKYGRIVTLASTAGIRGGTGRAAYGAAKGGVIALTRVMAVELAPHGITVNALAPGAIETELVKKMHSEETRRVYTRGIPLKRYGTPVETASAALYLASEEARYISGQILGVDGGFLAAGVMHDKTA